MLDLVNIETLITASDNIAVENNNCHIPTEWGHGMARSPQEHYGQEKNMYMSIHNTAHRCP